MGEYESKEKLIEAFNFWKKKYSKVSETAKLEDNEYIYYLGKLYHFNCEII